MFWSFKILFLLLIYIYIIIFFSIYSKIYIEFPMLSLNNMRNGCDDEQCRQLVPGDISFGVYLALKMAQLRMDFKVPLLMWVVYTIYYL